MALAAITLATVESSTELRALLDETDTCIGTCDDRDQKKRFCGVDSLCRPYSCQSWYEYGPRNLTGYDESFQEPLTCQDIPVDPEVFYSGIRYGCYETIPPRIKQGFTKQCATNPAGPSISFTCYEMATNTNFQPYLDEVTTSGLTCKNDTEIPNFGYYVTYSLRNKTGGYTVLTAGADSTFSFNATLALSTMYSEFILEEELSPGPTDSPTANPTNSPTSSTFALTPVIWAYAFISLYHLVLSV
jgi:hypothetical protein